MSSVIMRYRITFTFSFHIQSNFVTRGINSDCCKTHELNQILDKYHLLLQIQSMKWRCPSKECACLNICWSRRWVPLHLVKMILNMSGLISRQLSQYISVGSIFISCRSSTVLARVPSLAQKRAAILLRDFCDTEDHLDRKFQIYKFTFFQIKVLLPPFSIIKCNILSFIFTWYFYVSLSLTFLLCKVLPYIFTWY